MCKRKKITIEEESYPQGLRDIKDPPKELFCLGNLELFNKPSVSIVGSRKTSFYGRWVAKELGKRIARNNITVVSGLAMGIDTCAHESAIKFKGSTIAVLGAGLDYPYPKGNLNLRKEIEKEGLVITEYEDYIRPTKFTFPRRNRIISGISKATIVVEGGINSGAVITAELAGDQGRAVYAVPGNINSENSMGTNKLIKDGATPLVFLDDIIYDLGFSPENEENEYEKLSEKEKKIIDILRKHGEININQIYRIIGKKPEEINGTLTVLEIKGVIFCTMGKIFLAKK